MVNAKNGNLKCKTKHVLTLSDLSITFKHSGQYIALSRLVTYLHFVIWILRIINSMIELINLMMQHFLPSDTLNMLFGCIKTLKLRILDILSKFNLSTMGLNSLTYPVYLKINMLSLLFILILKIRNPLSFAISTINLFVVPSLTITN